MRFLWKSPSRVVITTLFVLLTITYFHGAAISGQLNLTWVDNLTDQLGFSIERATGTTGAFAQIGTSGAGVTVYADSGVADGTTYCYRVRAFNGAGYSGYSNVSCGAIPQLVGLAVVEMGTGSGTVTSTPSGITCGANCSASYPSGAAVTLIASPAAGSTFTGWSGGGCSGTGACTVTLTSTTTVIATFDVQSANLTVSKAGTGSGTVTSVPAGITCGTTCSASYSSGTAVTLTATPAAGSSFTGWNGGGCSGTGACTVTLTGATTVTVTFSATGTDSTPPTVAITTPTSTPTYSTSTSSLALGGTAADNVGVTQVSWASDRGGSGIAAGTTSWSASGIALQSGFNVLTVTARDAAGNTGTATLTVTYDATPPAVSITAPAAGATVSGTITVTASVSDNIGVVGVQFLLDGATLGAEQAAPFSRSWDTTSVANGAHTLSAKARDAAGNTTLAAAVTVTVSNAKPSSLVAVYAFNEGSGTSVADSSGNDNTGTISGATWTTQGRFGSALVFDGTSALVTIDDSPSLDLTTAMTLEAWVKPSVVNVAWTDVIYKGNDSYILMATSDRGGVPASGIVTTTSTYNQDTIAYGSTALAAGTWTHLATTYDGTTLRLYVNGSEVSSQPWTGDLWTTSYPVQIGGDPIWGSFFAGIIDEVRIYNRALSQAEIQTDMSTPVGDTPPIIAITAPTSGGAYTTTTSLLTLSGTATDNVGITQVSWVNDRGGSGIASGTTNWLASGIALQPGTNVLTVTARDVAGNTGSASVIVSLQTSLTVSRAGSGGGTVSSTPAGISCGTKCSASYPIGTAVTLTATPAAGSTFTGWSGGGCSGTGTCTVTLTGATTVTATFTPLSFTLRATKAGRGDGTVSSTPAGITCGRTCSASYSSGTVVTLTATPNSRSTFTGWSGGGCSGTGTCTVTVTAATTITATFRRK